MKEQNKHKERILKAAIDTLKENSIEDVSMRKIAAKAGLTTGAIYHFYSGKDELLFDCMKEQLHFTTKLYARVKSNVDKKRGEELIQEINSEVEKRIRKSDEQKIHIQVIGDILKGNCKIKDEFIQNYINMINSTSELFTQAFHIDSEYNPSVASLLVAAIDGIAIQQSLGVLPESLDQTIEVFIRFFNQSIPAFLKSNTKDKN